VVTVELAAVDPADPAAQRCLHEYFAELDRRFDAGFDPAVTRSTDLDGYRPPAGLFVVATRDGTPVGCGGLKFHPGGRAELKRMWVAGDARGLGLGRRLLADLEDRAREAGCGEVVLDTNRALTEAIALYRAAGYVEVDAFNDEPYAHHWFAKPL
jgi:GNAT superfamily N-acetyltransferase